MLALSTMLNTSGSLQVGARFPFKELARIVTGKISAPIAG